MRRFVQGKLALFRIVRQFKMKKLTAYFAALIMIMGLVCSGVSASANFNSEDFTKDLYSYAYYMISLDNGSEIFSKNEEKQIQPAAFNKLLAAIVAVESWGNLDETVTVSEKSLALYPREYGIRTALIKAGDTYTKRQLIDCLIIYSANDAASIIAYELAGSKDAFVQKMQELATKIGCKNTKVVDMFGFDAQGQYTTAKDVSLLVQYGLNYPAFAEAFSAKSVTMPATGESTERVYQGSNKMANTAIADYYHASVTGGKQTSTDESGESIAVISDMDGYSYLTVVMKGKLYDVDKDSVDENTCMTDAKALLNWVYSNIRFKVVASPGEVSYCVDITSGKGTDSLKLTPEKEISALVPLKVSSSSVLIVPIEETVPKKVSAPVKAGDVICQAKVMYANEEIATINLVAFEDVKLSFMGLLMNTLRAVLKSYVFIALEIIVLVALCVYLIIKLNENNKKTEAQVCGAFSDKTAARIMPQKKDVFAVFEKVFEFLKSDRSKRKNNDE